MEENFNNGVTMVEDSSPRVDQDPSHEEIVQRKISKDSESKCPAGDLREEEEEDLIKSERRLKLNMTPARPFSETESETAYGSMDEEASQEMTADLNSNEMEGGQSMPNSNTVDSISPSADFTSGAEDGLNFDECEEDTNKEDDNSSLNDLAETPRAERKAEATIESGDINGALSASENECHEAEMKKEVAEMDLQTPQTNHIESSLENGHSPESSPEKTKTSPSKSENSVKRQLGADGLHTSLPDLQAINTKEAIDDGESSDEDPIIAKTTRKDESLAAKKQKFNTLPRAAGRDEAKLNRMSALARMMQIINDDDKFPDSVTPTKVEHFSDTKDYDVPFIDDDAFYVEDWYFNEDNRWSFVDPNDNYEIETGKASDDLMNGSPEEVISQKKGSPLHSRPPTTRKKGLFGLCGCFSSQPH